MKITVAAILLLSACAAEYEAPIGAIQRVTTCMGQLPGGEVVTYEWTVAAQATWIVAAVDGPGAKRATEPVGNGVWDDGSYLLRPIDGRLEVYAPGGYQPDGTPLGRLAGTVPCMDFVP